MSRSAPSGERSTIAIESLGPSRTFRLIVPSMPPGAAAPLVLVLHGRGGGGTWFDRMTGLGDLAEREGFVLAAPDALDGRWNDGRDPPAAEQRAPDDVAFLEQVIDLVGARVAIDPRRIFVTGMSNGAAMAARFACARADRIAAVAQVAGTAAIGVAAACRPGGPVPLLVIHGTADRFAPYAGGQRRGLRARAMLAGRGPIGPSVGVEDWAMAWAARNGADPTPVVEHRPPDVTIRRWRGSTAASDIVVYAIEGGGHTWPGGEPGLPRLLFGRTSRTIRATDVIWSFFAAHERPAEVASERP